MKVFLKTLLAILVAIVIAGAIFLTNLIWFRPWSLNLVYEKTFVEVIFNEPELLISLGLVAINNAVYPSYQSSSILSKASCQRLQLTTGYGRCRMATPITLMPFVKTQQQP